MPIDLKDYLNDNAPFANISNKAFIMGNPDPENRHMAALVKALGGTVYWAAQSKNDFPVAAGGPKGIGPYDFSRILSAPEGGTIVDINELTKFDAVIWEECSFDATVDVGKTPVILIDHHGNKNTKPEGEDYEKFLWQKSSLGQFFALIGDPKAESLPQLLETLQLKDELGKMLTANYLLCIAAADHNQFEAIGSTINEQGEKVSEEDLIACKAYEIAKEYKGKDFLRKEENLEGATEAVKQIILVYKMSMLVFCDRNVSLQSLSTDLSPSTKDSATSKDSFYPFFKYHPETVVPGPGYNVPFLAAQVAIALTGTPGLLAKNNGDMLWVSGKEEFAIDAAKTLCYCTEGDNRIEIIAAYNKSLEAFHKSLSALKALDITSTEGFPQLPEAVDLTKLSTHKDPTLLIGRGATFQPGIPKTVNALKR